MKVLPATETHALWLAPVMRRECVEECLAYSGRSPKEALLNGLKKSDVCKTAFSRSGAIVAMFGVGRLQLAEGNVGSIWMLTSQAVESCTLEFLRTCKRELPKLQRDWDELINYVDARNHHILRWAQWMGFEMYPAIKYGVQGLPFHPIRIRSDRHV